MALWGAVAVLSLTAACGDSADDEAAGPTSTSATSAAPSPTADVGEYCATALEIETVPEPDIDFESASEEEIAAAVKQQAQEVYLPLAEDVEASAPDEIAADVDTLVAAVEELATTGDFETTFESPEVVAAEERVHAFDLANCGWEQVDVTAVDYAFQGIAGSYPAGPVSFELTNQGGELHEFVLLQKNEGVTESFEAILAGGEEEGGQKVTPLGGTFAAPGEDGYKVANLEPGEYAVVCFIPVGSTPEAEAAAEGSGEAPEGPPHFTQGMSSVFTVEQG
ncbi:MAG TPA: hypothetical protein VK975_04825 [Acidimicrobiales bacterium]|nr:hypothetical protein [Acidimicrobiales bacterium]